MVMNVQELRRETQRMESKRILDNVSTFYQKYISVEMEKGNGEVQKRQKINVEKMLKKISGDVRKTSHMNIWLVFYK